MRRVSMCTFVMAMLVVLPTMSASAAAPPGGLRPSLVGKIDLSAPMSTAPEVRKLLPEAGNDPWGLPETPLASSPLGGITPLVSGKYMCLHPVPTSWSYVAASVAGYVIGNCNDGWTLTRTQESGQVPAEGYLRYEGGYVGGSYQGCGWIRQDNVTTNGSGSTASCSNPDTAANAFAYVMNCQPTFCSDGTRTANTTCPQYANARPWLNPIQPQNRIYPDMPASYYSNPGVRWRYVTKYHYAGAEYAMVRDERVASGTPNWVFVPVACVTALPPGNGGYWYP